MSILLDPPRARPQRRAPFTLETRAKHERADTAAELALRSLIYDVANIGAETQHYSESALTTTQRAYSLRRSIQRCGQAGHRCGSALCARCSTGRASQLRRDLTASLRHQKGTAVLWTSTTATMPGRATRQAWGDLLSVIQATTRGGWLKRQGVAGTARAIEPEHTPGGVHVHAHTLLIFRNEISAEDIQRFALTARTRYLAEADRLGVAASAEGQDISRVRSLPRVVRYITKAGVRANGNDTPSQLWAAVQRGDADSLALIHELEAGSFRRRQFTTTGVCRPLMDFDDLLRSGAA